MAEQKTMTVDALSSSVDRVPLSAGQRSRWLLDLLAPTEEDRAAVWFPAPGRVRIEALRIAWRHTLARHDVVRTTISTEHGRPAQTVGPPRPESFEVIDLTAYGPVERAQLADALIATGWSGPVDIAAGPLVKLTLVRLTDQDHRVVLCGHRIAVDDRSLAMLADELSEFYTLALLEGSARSLPEVPARRYADHTRAELDRRHSPAYGESLDWWTQSLAPLAQAAHRVATSRPAGGAPGGRLPFVLDPAESLALRRFARGGQVPIRACVLAALLVVLGRQQNTDLVPVGLSTAARPHGFADVVGPFDHLMIVPGDLSGAPTFDGLTRRVAQAMSAARLRSGVALADILTTLGVDRDPHQLPYTDVIFDDDERPTGQLLLGGPAVAGVWLDPVPTRAGLSLRLDTHGRAIVGSLGYRGGASECAAAQLVLDQLYTVLRVGPRSPATRVADLPLDDDDRTARIAAAANRIADGAPTTWPVHELVRRHSARRTAAVSVGRAQVSYAELIGAATLIAGHLRGAGVAGRSVAIRIGHGAAQLATSLAVLQTGGYLIWLSPGDDGQRARSVLTQERPAALIVAQDGDELAAWFASELGGLVLDATRLDNIPLTTGGRAHVTAADVAYVAHTSGSTGTPKGVAQTHGSFAQFASWLGTAFDIRPGSRVAQWVAADHDPSLCETFAALIAGATLCPVPQRVRVHPERFLDWLIEERITFLQTVPSFARELLRAARATGTAGRLTALRHLVLMGEALPAELAREVHQTLPSTRLANLYGPTETIAATWCAVTPDVIADAGGAAPIGEPIPGREVLVVDERDRPCPTGVVGEIVIRGPHVAHGYVGDPGAGAFRALRPAGGEPEAAGGVPTYRTGDLARRRPDGLLEFAGRRDQQVKVQGNRLELSEVEAALIDHGSVAECVVVPRTDDQGFVQQLIAYVVPRSVSGPAGAGAWRAHLHARYGRSLPVLFETLDTPLPRNVAGKVDRGRLPAPRAGARPAARPPRSPAEHRIAAAWSRLLGVGPGDALQTFFASGGDSASLVELVDQVRREFGVDLPLRACFANPTVAALAALVESASPAATGTDPA